MSTGYAAGMRNYLITIVNRTEAQAGRFGLDSAGIIWEDGPTIHASITWAKGVRTLNAGAIDAYGVIVVRIDYNDIINMRSRIKWDGQTYQILPDTFHADKIANTIQFNAQVIINDYKYETEGGSGSSL